MEIIKPNIPLSFYSFCIKAGNNKVKDVAFAIKDVVVVIKAVAFAIKDVAFAVILILFVLSWMAF